MHTTTAGHSCPWGLVTAQLRTEYLDGDATVFRGVVQEDEYRVRDLPKIDTCIDIGANIGCFARMLHARDASRIVCVEADPANLEILNRNVQGIASVVGAACTYEPPPLVIRSTIYRGTHNTGGSAVISPDTPDQSEHGTQPRYTLADEDVVTIERVMDQHAFKCVDLLKLDCEGSENSILASLTAASRAQIGIILGEWHDWSAFQTSVIAFDKRLWTHDFLSEPGKPFGLFRLSRTAWLNDWEHRAVAASTLA